MKLAFSTLVAPDWTLQQIIHHAVLFKVGGIDFRGIGPELDITTLPAFMMDLQRTLRLLDESHLELPCLNSSITLVTVDRLKWESMLSEARRYAQLAQHTNTKLIRIFGGAIPQGLSREQARELARKNLRQLIEITQPFGCKPLLETHDAWVLSTEILELLHGFDASEVGVLWDVEHPWRAGEPPTQTVSQLAQRIEHVHVKDTLRSNGASLPMLLGHGELPLKESLDALKNIPYAGWISLETEKRWHRTGPEPEDSIPQFVDFMKSWSEIAV